MSSIRIGFIGDPHVGRAGRWVDDVTALKMHRRLLEQGVAMCHARRCTHAVILGDVFDNPTPNQDQLSAVLKALTQLKDVQTDVLMGNHDVQDAHVNSLIFLRELPGAGALTNVRFHLKRAAVDLDGHRAIVVPWGEQVPRTHMDLLLFHDAIAGAKMDNGYPSKGGLRGVRETGVPAFGGHLHVTQRSGNVVFSGTAAQMGFGEPLHKRFWWMTLRPGRDPVIESERIRDPVWQLKRVTYSSHDTPRVNEPRTYYSLDVGNEQPPARWLTDHPQVVKLHGGGMKRMMNVAQNVANLLEGGTTQGVDDRDLLARYLRKHSSLDALMRQRAMKLHDRLHKGE